MPPRSQYSHLKPAGAYAVYRVYSATGECLYIGCSARLLERLYRHAETRPWWSEVDRSLTEAEWYDHPDEAAEREHELIRALHPRYNIAGVTPGRGARYGGRRQPLGPSSAHQLAHWR